MASHESPTNESVEADQETGTEIHCNTGAHGLTEEVNMTENAVESMTAQIFHDQIQIMKDTLDRGLMIYQGDKQNRGYRQFKQETMRTFHEFIDAFWQTLVSRGLVEKCECGAPTRRWSECPLCGGAGFKVIEEEPCELSEDAG